MPKMYIRHFNRIKRKTPKSSGYYCWGCDANIVQNGIKCEVCGRRDKPKRFKKDKSINEE